MISSPNLVETRCAEQIDEQASTINGIALVKTRGTIMFSKPKGMGSQTHLATATHEAETSGPSGGNAAGDEEIRRRFYEIYLERGELPGRQLDDWLQVEREFGRGVLSRPPAG